MKQALHIGILGSRGIPNYYGGFEQLAQYLGEGLVKAGHVVTVYNSHDHPYKEKKWKGVSIVHCHDAEPYLGTAGQFIYDFNCIRDARKKNFDVLLFLGYTSSSVWGKWFPKNALIISNMDGLEWKRTKYIKPVRQFLKHAEKLAVKYSDFLIADSIAVQFYLKEKYKTDAAYISYGAEIFTGENEAHPALFNISQHNYFMLMARMEPENNIEMILEGFRETNSDKYFLVIGNTENRFGKKMKRKFAGDNRILFAGAIYDAAILHSLKYFSSLYFHGHSVGGTNPSLLEAMASRALIAAHDNAFNKAVLGDDAYYFTSAKKVTELINADYNESANEMKQRNIYKIKEQHYWPDIIDRYEKFISSLYYQCNQ